jgi:hypothetical protein
MNIMPAVVTGAHAVAIEDGEDRTAEGAGGFMKGCRRSSSVKQKTQTWARLKRTTAGRVRQRSHSGSRPMKSGGLTAGGVEFVPLI